MDFKWVSDLLKMPIKIIVALMFSAGLILFVPDNIAQTLFVLDFRNKYGFIIGVVFVVSSAILATTLFLIVGNFIRKKIRNKITLRSRNKLLRDLSKYQEAIVYKLYITANNICRLPMQEGAILELEQYVIIHKAGSNFAVDMYNPIVPYFLQKWVVWELDKDSVLSSKFKEAYKHYKKDLEYFEY